MFYASGLIFGGSEVVGSRFHVLQARTYFWRYRGPYLFLAISWASAPIFMFCIPRLIFGDTVGVSPVFMFCAPVLIFGDTEGVKSHFHVLRARGSFSAI
jgi:hypothetical protein